MKNTLYYGDNLDILKKHLTHDSFIDLIYIDPPFNSKRNYNILYEDLIRSKENGDKATALKEAFADTWSNVSISHELEEMKGFANLKLYKFLTNNREIFSDSQMSYLTMMSLRIYYMHKLLKDIRLPYSKDTLDRLRYKAQAFRGEKVYNNYKENPKGKHPED